MLTLYRYLSNLKNTRGILIYEGVPICHTLELPYFQNQKYVSCIPQGDYDVHKSTSALHGSCFRFSYVPYRSGILIHAGNNPSNTRGCILPGLDVSASGVIYSRKAMDRLLTILPDALTLTVKGI